jgi:hypothetical protein
MVKPVFPLLLCGSGPCITCEIDRFVRFLCHVNEGNFFNTSYKSVAEEHTLSL